MVRICSSAASRRAKHIQSRHASLHGAEPWFVYVVVQPQGQQNSKEKHMLPAVICFVSVLCTASLASFGMDAAAIAAAGDGGTTMTSAQEV